MLKTIGRLPFDKRRGVRLGTAPNREAVPFHCEYEKRTGGKVTIHSKAGQFPLKLGGLSEKRDKTAEKRTILCGKMPQLFPKMLFKEKNVKIFTKYRQKLSIQHLKNKEYFDIILKTGAF